MDYLDIQHDRRENDMGYFSRLAAAQQEAREGILNDSEAFSDFDWQHEFTAGCADYIRHMLQEADAAFDGDEKAIRIITHNLSLMMRRYERTVNEMVEEHYNDEVEA